MPNFESSPDSTNDSTVGLPLTWERSLLMPQGLRNNYGEMMYSAKEERYKGYWLKGLYHGQGQYWWVRLIIDNFQKKN